MIDFFTRDWEQVDFPGCTPGALYRDAYIGCAHIWPCAVPTWEWEWWVEIGEDLEALARGYTDSLEEAQGIASAVFLALAALRPEDGPEALPL